MVPSASIELSRISPTPSSTPRRAHSTASRPAAVRPPWVVTSKPDGCPVARRAIHREHEHLVAEPAGDLADHLGASDGAGVDRHLVGAGPEQGVDVIDRADAAADGQRDEDGLGGSPDDVERGLAALGGGRDVEEGQLVGALGVVDRQPSSTGSPASRRSTKLTPLTTRPPCTSRQGMTRTATVTTNSLLIASLAALALSVCSLRSLRSGVRP